MVNPKTNSQVVRTWTPSSAATGEGERYETASGEVWTEVNRFSYLGTGERSGHLIGDQIVEADSF